MTCSTLLIAPPVDLWQEADKIRARIKSSRRVFLFLDFDGTLAPIVSMPALAALAPECNTILRALAARNDVATVVISGRSLEDLRRRVGLPVIYAGNYGLEIQGPGLSRAVEGALEIRAQLFHICNRLRAGLSRYSGVLVECKSLTATVHVRQAQPAELEAAHAVVRSIIDADPRFETSLGKDAIEIHPAIPWNKGSAARWILRQCSGLESETICVGDDFLDEPMFQELSRGITVRVGPREPTCAAYFLEQTEVARLLALVLDTVDARPREEKSRAVGKE